jgi:hypothetical protein
MALLSGSGSAAFKSIDRTNFTATAAQTTFTVSQGYSVGDVDVFLNGVKLFEGDDYYAINGSTVVLTSGAAAGDSVQVVSYNQFSAANTYTKTEADNKYMVATGQTPMTSYLRTPNYGISSWSDSAYAAMEASVGAGTQGAGIRAYGRSVPSIGGEITYITDTRGGSGSHKFYGWNGSSLVNMMNIDPYGRMNVVNQPAFSSYNPATNETTAAFSPAPFTGTRFNIGGYFSTTNRRFTAPVAGRYLFTTCSNVNGVASGGCNAAFYVNGSQATSWAYMTTNNNWMLMSFSAIINLNANDYVDVRPGVPMHWDYGGSVWSQFDGYLLG